MGWGFALVHICFQYSLRKHQILSRLFYGTELATPLESMWDLTEVHVSNNLEKVKDFWAEAIKNLRTERDQVARRYNAARKATIFRVGDVVVYRIKVLSSKGKGAWEQLELNRSKPMVNHQILHNHPTLILVWCFLKAQVSQQKECSQVNWTKVVTSQILEHWRGEIWTMHAELFWMVSAQCSFSVSR